VVLVFTTMATTQVLIQTTTTKSNLAKP
jgi:hypothetical protein